MALQLSGTIAGSPIQLNAYGRIDRCKCIYKVISLYIYYYNVKRGRHFSLSGMPSNTHNQHCRKQQQTIGPNARKNGTNSASLQAGSSSRTRLLLAKRRAHRVTPNRTPAYFWQSTKVRHEHGADGLWNTPRNRSGPNSPVELYLVDAISRRHSRGSNRIAIKEYTATPSMAANRTM
jgi:hypothetical protein